MDDTESNIHEAGDRTTPPAYLDAMPGTRNAASPVPTPQFQQETVRLVSLLRELLTGLVAALPQSVRTASEFQRATKLDMKLCWKVFRVLSTPDPLSAAQYIPGPGNLRDLLKTMKRLGAPAALIERAAEAAEQFEQLVREHAQDRRTFDSMVSGFAGTEREKVGVRERRAAYQANSYIWGVRSEAMVMTLIQSACEHDPTRIDEIALRSDFGLRRLRPTPMPLFQLKYATLDANSREYSGGRRVPLSGDGSGLGLIPEFCTRPLPEVSVCNDADGRSTATLLHSELGMKAAVDLVTGCVLREGAPRYRGIESFVWATMQIGKPCRTAIIDLLVEDGFLPASVVPRGFMTARNHMTPPIHELWTASQFSDGEPIVRLGRGPAALATAEVPRYPELIAWSIRQAGLDPDRFEAWRLRVEYPIALSTVGVVYDIPEMPTSARGSS
ncbi:MAG: hypothetical protein H7210_07735 [Pyrinomonadaceae bacterium]|nr:hypothetical protein [Phycisphaerales bacterium]